MITAKPATGKQCAICLSEKQVVEVNFHDNSFSGHLCMKDLWRMLDKRAKKNGKAAQELTQHTQQTSSRQRETATAAES